jgi:hypothetical protein
VTLKRVYLLIDSRHGIKKNDEEVMDLLDKAAMSYQVVLTKIDKIKEAGVPRLLAETAEAQKAAGRLSGSACHLVGKEYRHRGAAGGHALAITRNQLIVRQFFGRLEGQRHAVDAVTLAGRRRAVIEDVAEMAAATAAMLFLARIETA